MFVCVFFAVNLTVATIRSRGHQPVALGAPRLPAFSYWVAELRIGMPAVVLMMVFCRESIGGDDSEQRASDSCAARSQVTCFFVLGFEASNRNVSGCFNHGFFAVNPMVATIRSIGHQTVALRAPRLHVFSYWVSKLRIGMPAAVFIMVFCRETNGGDGSEVVVMNLLPQQMRNMQ